MTFSFTQRIIALTLTFAASLILPAQAQITIDPPEPAWVLSAKTAQANLAFSLTVESYRYSCATTFANHEVRVTDNRIDLSFTTATKPDVACPMIYKPYGTAFSIPGLKVGTYKVFVNLLLPCHVNQPACKAAIPIEEAGTLVVTGGASNLRQGWFLKNPEVQANGDFTLSLLNNQYGNCNTSFSHTNYATQINRINVSFTIESNPKQVCIVDVRPHGPTFAATGLKTGRYPVYVTVMPACLFSVPQCLMIPPLAAEPSDTLVVMQSLGLKENATRFQAKFTAAGTTEGLTIGLPADAEGIWRADLLSLSGQRLQSQSLTTQTGRTFSMPIQGKIQRGIYWVRLVSPTQETHRVRLTIQN